MGCTPYSDAGNPIICEDNGNIEGDCNEATTAPPTPPPKHCVDDGYNHNKIIISKLLFCLCYILITKNCEICKNI